MNIAGYSLEDWLQWAKETRDRLDRGFKDAGPPYVKMKMLDADIAVSHLLLHLTMLDVGESKT